jgi:Concanavalin A-like lectin/glucanases superfamily
MTGNWRHWVAACGLAIDLCACHVAPDTVASSYGDAGTGGSGGSTTSDAGSVCTGRFGTDGGTDAGLSQGLVAYYACDQATGATLPDQSGNNNNATLVTGSGGTGGYSFTTGKVGNALLLIAANDGYATLPAGILANACEATIAAWVNIKTQVNYQRVWDFGWDSTVYMYLTPSDAIGMPRFGISIAGNGSHEFGIDGKDALPLDEWHHLAVVLGPSGVVLYVDGQPAGTNASITLRPADLGSTPNNYIGRSQFSADAYLDGAIDEFRVYDRALSPREIQTLASGS